MGKCKAYLYSHQKKNAAQEFHFDEFFDSFSGIVDMENKLIIVAISHDELAVLELPDWLPHEQKKSWSQFYEKLIVTYSQFKKAQSLLSETGRPSRNFFCFSWPEQNPDNTIQTISVFSEGEPQYVALIGQDAEDISSLIVWGYLFSLATKWHVEQGGLSIHSSAVARGDDGFLFLGHSKAGKSTVAELSAAIGLLPLGDDLNFVVRNPQNGYRLAAAPNAKIPKVSYSLEKPRLRGIFALVQDKSDHLVPIMPIKLAPILFDSFIQQTPYVRRIADKLVEKAFQTVCELARQVPGFELHFRKSPDFWKLIDEKFPE
jgi:hypothetical protein